MRIIQWFKSQPSNVVILRNITEALVGNVPEGKISENIDKDLIHLDEFASLCARIYEEPENEPELKLEEFAPQVWDLKYTPEVPSAPKYKYFVKGLGCLIWVKNRPTSAPLAVIVFRGTDSTQVGDWLSNFRWITRIIPFFWDQYDQTRALIPKLVEGILNDYNNKVELVAAGHSLGGGLAQQAGYVSKHIKKVYTFDPSVVTGYHSVCKENRKINEKGMRIYRTYEHGETLAYLRWLFKSIYPISNKNPKIVEIRYNLTSGSPLSQHSIRDLASRLTEISSSINSN